MILSDNFDMKKCFWNACPIFEFCRFIFNLLKKIIKYSKFTIKKRLALWWIIHIQLLLMQYNYFSQFNSTFLNTFVWTNCLTKWIYYIWWANNMTNVNSRDLWQCIQNSTRVVIFDIACDMWYIYTLIIALLFYEIFHKQPSIFAWVFVKPIIMLTKLSDPFSIC